MKTKQVDYIGARQWLIEIASKPGRHGAIYDNNGTMHQWDKTKYQWISRHSGHLPWKASIGPQKEDGPYFIPLNDEPAKPRPLTVEEIKASKVVWYWSPDGGSAWPVNDWMVKADIFAYGLNCYATKEDCIKAEGGV